jgi:multidrug efflux system membrane fusion protein
MRFVAALSVMGLVVVAAVVAAACGAPAEVKHERPPTPVTVVDAKAEDVPINVGVIGSVVPIATVAVQPRVQGPITRIAFKEGEAVEKGQVLFEIDAAPYAAALAQAQAVLAKDQVQSENADADSARYQQLVAQKLVSPQDAELKAATAKAMKAQVVADQAAVDNAKLNLAWTRVTSPVAGRADKRQVDLGNLVQPNGNAVTTIRQIAPIQVQFALPQDLLFDVQEKSKAGALVVAATIPGHAETVEKGALSFVGSAVDASTGTVQCKADFDNKDSHLWPGAYVQVKLTLGERKDAVVVPATTVQTSQQGSFAYVVKSDGTAEMRPIVAGLNHDGVVVIDSGIQAGEKVVVDGQLSLIPGAKVVAKPPVSDASAVAASGGRDPGSSGVAASSGAPAASSGAPAASSGATSRSVQ